MKFSIVVHYTVVKNDYQTNHTFVKDCEATDAAVCLSSHLNQLAADTDGIITGIQTIVKELSLKEYLKRIETNG